MLHSDVTINNRSTSRIDFLDVNLLLFGCEQIWWPVVDLPVESFYCSAVMGSSQTARGQQVIPRFDMAWHVALCQRKLDDIQRNIHVTTTC